MAPNIPLRHPELFVDSGEESRETIDFVSPVPSHPPSLLPSDAPSIMPELFVSHLPQHFQDPDSPNLHMVQQTQTTSQPATKTQRSTLRIHRPISTTASTTNQDEDQSATQPGRAREDRIRVTSVRNPSNRKFLPEGSEVDQNSPDAPVQVSTDGALQLPQNPQVPSVPVRSPDGLKPESVVHIPSDSPGQGTTRRRIADRPQKSGSTAKTTVRTPTSFPSTTHRHDPGVLKLPGHEPEAPADLVLIHHDRAIDTRNQTGLNGIYVRDDSTSLTPEGATALILVGLCVVFLVFICFIVFVQKIRRQRLERKVQQDGDVIKPSPTYETTASTSTLVSNHTSTSNLISNDSQNPHTNPLSLLPPALVQALTLAVQGSTKEEQPSPTFLKMEPPLSSNSLGRLWFSVYYDHLMSDLVVKVHHARYTRGRGWSSNPGDVWVEAVVLTPLNTVMGTANTGKRRASSAPVFKQTFRFKVDDEEVTQYLLRLTLYDRHPEHPGEKASGSVIVPLSSLDLGSQEVLARDLQ